MARVVTCESNASLLEAKSAGLLREQPSRSRLVTRQQAFTTHLSNGIGRSQGVCRAQTAANPLSSLPFPIHSLSTNAQSAGDRPTLNLVGYCSPASIDPQLLSVSIYKGTQSHKNFVDAGKGARGVLQV